MKVQNLFKTKKIIRKIQRILYLQLARRKYIARAPVKIAKDLSINNRIKLFFELDTPSLLDKLVQNAAVLSTRDEIAFADNAKKKSFFFLGHVFNFTNSNILWDYDPVTQKQWGNQFSFDIPYRGPARLSDIKLPWELAKMQYLFSLGKAYCYTGHGQYAETIIEHIKSWISSNPPFSGIHWVSALEVGMRVVSFIMVYPFIKKYAGTAFTTTYLTSIFQQTEFIENNLSLSDFPNTHLIGEAFALMLAGFFLNSPKSKKWQTKGSQILHREIYRQVHPDGINKEQSISYQRFFLDYYYLFILFHRKNNITYSKDIDTITEKMTEYLVCSVMPNGDLPNWGDADDARGLWVKQGCEKDFSGLFALGAVLFERADFKYPVQQDMPDEIPWLLGIGGIEKYNSMTETCSDKWTRSWDAGGYHIIRNGFNKKSDCLAFDCGTLGWGPAGHGHADALSFQLCKNGQLFLIDPGTYSYNLDYAVRDYFRSTRAHNTVEVDGVDQSEMNDRMSWKTFAESKLTYHLETENFCFMGAMHNGYKRLPDPVTAKRYIFHDFDDLWLIYDYFLCKNQHTYIHRLHLDNHCELQNSLNSNTQITAVKNSEKLFIDYLGEEKIDTIVGQKTPLMLGWISNSYGDLQKAHTICLEKTAFGDTDIICGLSSTEKPLLNRLSSRVGELAIQYNPCKDKTCLFYYNATALKQEWQSDKIIFNGELLYLKQGANGVNQPSGIDALLARNFFTLNFPLLGKISCKGKIKRLSLCSISNQITIETDNRNVNKTLHYEFDSRYQIVID